MFHTQNLITISSATRLSRLDHIRFCHRLNARNEFKLLKIKNLSNEKSRVNDSNDKSTHGPRARQFAELNDRNYWNWSTTDTFNALRSSFSLTLFSKVYFTIFFRFIIIMKTYLFLEHFWELPDVLLAKTEPDKRARIVIVWLHFVAFYLHKSGKRNCGRERIA